MDLLAHLVFRRPNTTDLVLENLALRQQLAVLQRSVKRPRLRRRDRAFWVLLSRVWANWRSALMIVKPDTVVGWHRKGFKLYWRWKSRKRSPGRSPVSPEIRALVRQMAEANPLWGAPWARWPQWTSSPWRRPCSASSTPSSYSATTDEGCCTSTSRLTRYCHHDRTHYSLNKDTPLHRPIDPRPPGGGHVMALPRLGGLHHRYEWREAA